MPIRILVADDSLIDRQLATGLLERNADYEIETARDGQDALDRLEARSSEGGENGFDLVVTDLQMPEIDGLALVKRIRAERPGLPVVLMTAQGSEEIAVEALACGAASYVPKRLLAEELPATVERVVAAIGDSESRARLMGGLKEMSLRFTLGHDPAQLSALANHLRSLVEDAAGEAGNRTESLRLGIALEEALTNACFHGNLEVDSSLREDDYALYYRVAADRAAADPYRDRRVRVQATIAPCASSDVAADADAADACDIEFRCTIADEGPGFDPQSLPDPTDPLNLDRPSGRGVLLMKTFMDEVAYNARGNEVTLVKRIARLVEPLEEPAGEAVVSG